jgi:hypothetical protein
MVPHDPSATVRDPPSGGCCPSAARQASSAVIYRRNPRRDVHGDPSTVDIAPGCHGRLVMILLSQQGWPAAHITGLLGYDPRPCGAGSTATASTAAAGRPTGPELATAARQSRLGRRIRRLLQQPHAWTIPGCGALRGAHRSPCGPCTVGCARSPAGGGPVWSPRATQIGTRSWPSCTSRSGTSPTARWCWPRTRPTSRIRQPPLDMRATH